ncbi:MAG TPA: PDDEXK nuclease domain-containing protein, partial [Bacteroidia bacterium]|nr:PDDEXK nuclease domain-containing protein [Bacteroidia bacterium]
MSKILYTKFIHQLKEEILKSRYIAAKLVNKELLVLYYKIGKLLTDKTTNANWGAKVLENISADLQREFPGLRGFSRSNLANMKQFYGYYSTIEITDKPNSKSSKKTDKVELIQSVTGLIFPYFTGTSEGKKRKNVTKISSEQLNHFFSISFTHHICILSGAKSWDEKLFYIQKAATNQWSVDLLENQLQSDYYKKCGKLPNNFKVTLPKELRETAISSFKDEYLLDFLAIHDKDNPNERELEDAIIKNIRSFILSLGKEFAFIGNQYRLVFEEEEYFVDLLFYHRELQSLVAIDL